MNKKELVRKKNQTLLLDAAEALFSTLGYDRTSVSLIAAKAKVPKANVLYYFKNKENLYSAVLERIMSGWGVGLVDLSAEDEPAQALYQYIRFKVRVSCEFPAQSRLFTTEIIRGAPHLGAHLREQTRPWFRNIITVIQAWIDAGKIRPVDPSHLLYMIWSSTQYYADYQTEVFILENKLEYEDSDIESITQSISKVILTGLGLEVPELN
ncbi:TetR/AcrR family transcriptional regulator [Alteromonas aestuariivivens]|nr:TetR/AcrR family transcriptional regulator [Alteromonas aestuariivivens]